MFEIIKQASYKVSQWSGGSTTEIFLAPRDGSYAERRFDVRISSATVELEESDFTPLEGVKRYLTILEGTMELTFQEEPQRQVVLQPYEVVEFLGDVPTHSVGTARDFNLMLKGCQGEMKVLVGKNAELAVPEGVEVFVYGEHPWQAEAEGTDTDVKACDTLHIFPEKEKKCYELKGDGPWIVIMVKA